jgi:hypothetical protein
MSPSCGCPSFHSQYNILIIDICKSTRQKKFDLGGIYGILGK